MSRFLVGCMICLILTAGGSGCGMNKKLSAEEKAVEYMEKKYEEEFQFTGWKKTAFGSNSKSAGMQSDSLPGKNIRVDIRETEEGNTIYSDNYMAYRLEEELSEKIEEVTGTVYSRYKIVLRISASEFPANMGPGEDATDISGDKGTLLSALIFIEEDEQRAEKLEAWRQSAEDAGLRVKGVLYVVADIGKYQDIDEENYQSRIVGEGWYKECCYFAMDKSYEFYYANWR